MESKGDGLDVDLRALMLCLAESDKVSRKNSIKAVMSFVSC